MRYLGENLDARIITVEHNSLMDEQIAKLNEANASHVSKNLCYLQSSSHVASSGENNLILDEVILNPLHLAWFQYLLPAQNVRTAIRGRMSQQWMERFLPHTRTARPSGLVSYSGSLECQHAGRCLLFTIFCW